MAALPNAPPVAAEEESVSSENVSLPWESDAIYEQFNAALTTEFMDSSVTFRRDRDMPRAGTITTITYNATTPSCACTRTTRERVFSRIISRALDLNGDTFSTLAPERLAMIVQVVKADIKACVDDWAAGVRSIADARKAENVLVGRVTGLHAEDVALEFHGPRVLSIKGTIEAYVFIY